MAHETHRKRITVAELIAWCKGSSTFSETVRRRPAGTIRHDSRTIEKGDIFLALATEQNDGHAFVEAAFKAGASAAIVAKRASFEVSAKYAGKLIRVNDPLAAVQMAAKRYRKELGILIVGITGSSGKTTTRNFIATVLKKGFVVGETYTNWNNHIGVPLSLLKFTGEEWIGVIEMGANHSGEIGMLSKIAEPDIGVITNIGYAHVGLFGSLSHTTQAKFEITQGLKKKDGFLLLNADDARSVTAAGTIKKKALFFGVSKHASIVPENIAVDRNNGCSFTVDGSAFSIRMPGRHFVYSALPAIFLGRRCGIPDGAIAEALASIEPVSMRGTIEKIGTVDYIVDCYNANPSSMESALVYLNDVAGTSRKVAVLGEMLELGRYSARLHRTLGRKAAQMGVDALVAVGPSAAIVAQGAREAHMAQKSIHICENAGEAVPLVEKVARAGDTVLLKGSRGMHLETIFQHMKAHA